MITVTDNVLDTGDQVQATSLGTGILGVNITYQGTYRTLSNAHVLTQFDPKGIGNMIRYRPNQAKSFTNLYPVSDQVNVTYYTNPEQQNPTYNIMDIAWGDVTNIAFASPTIRAVGGVSIQTSGEVRAPKSGEEFMLGNYRLCKSTKITSLIVNYKSTGVDSSGATIYTWWSSGISYVNPGTRPGDSGTAMVASSDKAVIGLHKSASTTTGYGCRI